MAKTCKTVNLIDNAFRLKIVNWRKTSMRDNQASGVIDKGKKKIVITCEIMAKVNITFSTSRN